MPKVRQLQMKCRNKTSSIVWPVTEILMLFWSQTLKLQPWTPYKKIMNLPQPSVPINRQDTSWPKNFATVDSSLQSLSRGRDTDTKVVRGKPLMELEGDDAPCKTVSWIPTVGFAASVAIGVVNAQWRISLGPPDQVPTLQQPRPRPWWPWVTSAVCHSSSWDCLRQYSMSPSRFWQPVLCVYPRKVLDGIVIGVKFLGNLIRMTIHGVRDLWTVRPLPGKDSATASGMRPTIDRWTLRKIETNPIS